MPINEKAQIATNQTIAEENKDTANRFFPANFLMGREVTFSIGEISASTVNPK